MKVHARALVATALRSEGGAIRLASPAPGLLRLAIRAGDVVRPGGVIGELEVLGQRLAVTAPDGAGGAVVEVCGGGAFARPAVDFGAMIAVLDPSAGLAPGASGEAAAPASAAQAGGRVFAAPTSGRFYGRAAPDKPPFVAAGAELVAGATICLLEVMKTFHRVTYSGEPVRVRAVLVADGADVNAGDALLALE